jgi:hypothetical protein
MQGLQFAGTNSAFGFFLSQGLQTNYTNSLQTKHKVQTSCKHVASKDFKIWKVCTVYYMVLTYLQAIGLRDLQARSICKLDLQDL